MAMEDLRPEAPAFARAGKIRLGIKVTNKDGVEHPQEVPYFVLNDVPELADHFKATAGTDQPTELPIFFPFDEIDAVLDGWHKLHMSSSMWCKGDGKKAVYAIDTQSGKRVVDNGRVIRPFSLKREDGNTISFESGDIIPCPGYEKVNAWTRCQYCKPHTTIIFMIRGLPVEKLKMAVYHIETPSVNNYPRLYQQLLGIKRLAGQLTGNEYLAGVPIILKRVSGETGSPNLDKNGNPKKGKDGKSLPVRARREHYFLELEVEPDWIQSCLVKQMQLAAPNNHLLPENVTIDAEIEDYINGEDPATTEDNPWVQFAQWVVTEIPFYPNENQVVFALDHLRLKYTPEDEQAIFDALARYAGQKADAKAGEA